ncbi:MAG: ROK family protein [Bacteroidales bacterium]|nr:ROK family protein [Bacteroidales bacterium]
MVRVLQLSHTPLLQKQSRDYLIEKLIDSVRDIRRIVAGKGINPICIGTSAKGFIDHRAGVIVGPDQGIKDWINVPFARIVKQETGLPVYVDNDANMMTIAEHRFGAARGYKNVIFVALRTGIGGGIIINGKLYRGAGNAGGEIGQMIINYDNGTSDKGIKGSYEHFASAASIVRRYNEESGISPGKRQKSISCKEIFELSYNNSPEAVTVVKENAEMVGIGLANLITIFAPEIIVLGGGMSEAHDSYISMIRETAFANSLENCRSELRIERAQLGTVGSLLGSAYWSLTSLAGQNI